MSLPPSTSSSIFNSSYFQAGQLTLSVADKRYLLLSGGTIGGSLAATGTLSASALAVSGGSAPSSGTAIGMRYDVSGDVGILNAYDHTSAAQKGININNGSVFIKADKSVGIGNVAPAYALDVVGSTKTASLLVGTSTNASHMISCLDSAMAIGNTRFISLGYANSESNQLEIGFTRNTANSWSIGFHSHAMIYGTSASSNYYIGINRSSPSYQLDVNGTTNASSYRVGGSEVINSSGVFVGSGGVDITNRIYLKNNGYGLSIRGNTANNDTELVSLVDGGGGHLGTYTSHALSLMTGNTDRVRVFPSGTVSIGTNSSSNARLYLTSGVGSSTIPGSDTIQKIERTGFSQPLEPVIVSNPSLICSDNIITYGALFVASDRRLKRDIRPCAEGDALRFVRDVEPIRYRLKSGDSRVHYGYIAQQLMEHRFGELIDIQADQNMEDEGDEYDLVGYRLSIDYSRSCVLLHRAMQRMLAMLEEQQATIDKLESKLG